MENPFNQILSPRICTMLNRYWEIKGYDSSEIIFEQRIPVGYFTENQIQVLLRTLAAKAGLSFEEIVGALTRRRTKIANNLLEVHKNSAYPDYSCGDNPHFHARVVKVEK